MSFFDNLGIGISAQWDELFKTNSHLTRVFGIKYDDEIGALNVNYYNITIGKRQRRGSNSKKVRKELVTIYDSQYNKIVSFDLEDWMYFTNIDMISVNTIVDFDIFSNYTSIKLDTLCNIEILENICCKNIYIHKTNIKLNNITADLITIENSIDIKNITNVTCKNLKSFETVASNFFYNGQAICSYYVDEKIEQQLYLLDQLYIEDNPYKTYCNTAYIEIAKNLFHSILYKQSKTTIYDDALKSLKDNNNINLINVFAGLNPSYITNSEAYCEYEIKL